MSSLDQHQREPAPAADLLRAGRLRGGVRGRQQPPRALPAAHAAVGLPAARADPGAVGRDPDPDPARGPGPHLREDGPDRLQPGQRPARRLGGRARPAAERGPHLPVRDRPRSWSRPSSARRWRTSTPSSPRLRWPLRRWPRCTAPGCTTAARSWSRSSAPASTRRSMPTSASPGRSGARWRPAASGPGRWACAGCSTSSAPTSSRSWTTTPRPTTCPGWRRTWPSCPVCTSPTCTGTCRACGS